MKKHRSWKLPLDEAAKSRLAASLYEEHDRRLSDGFKLCGSTGFWRTKHGLVTARLVYRKRRAKNHVTTITITYRGLQVRAAS